MELSLLLLVFLALLSGFFSASEIALFSLPTARIRSYRNSKILKQRLLAELLSDSRGLLVTIFTANTIVNILLQNVTSDLSPHSSGDLLVKIVLPFLIMLIFGEFLPKYIGLIASPQLSNVATYPIWYLKKLLYVFTAVAMQISEFFVSPILSLFELSNRPSDDEIAALLQTQSGNSPLTTDEAKFIHNFLDIDKLQAKEIMIPRHLVQLVSIEKFQKEAVSKNFDTPTLIFDHALDKPIGALGEQGEIIPIAFIPETGGVGAAFFTLLQGKHEVGCVVDEYGLLVGVITQKELFNRLFAHTTPKNPLIEKVNKNVLVANAQLPLSIVNSHFGTTLKSSYHSVTINGLLCERSNEIPKAGQQFTILPLQFTVLRSSNKQVLKVRVSRANGEKSLK